MAEKFPRRNVINGENTTLVYQHAAGATEYLEKHKLKEFFENLTAALVYERPEDIKAFACEFIERLQKAKMEPNVAQPPCLIDNSNLESIFGMLDITKKGYIHLVQYTKAMENLGLKRFNSKPQGVSLNKISKDTFMREAKIALRNNCSTFTY